MNADARAVLTYLVEHVGVDMFISFAPIMRHTKLDRPTVRRACRMLKRRGLADFSAGLWNDDGEPCGSGYCATDAGRESIIGAEP